MVQCKGVLRNFFGNSWERLGAGGKVLGVWEETSMRFFLPTKGSKVQALLCYETFLKDFE